ncbi:probable beta-1,4-xylosyltransferase IRX9H [Zingiber officinale]|uniref:probable beta-1,4-xylosyltransferase IRX9H n=1 Tax=Zingiber officinale TaxID=94328 RepID=UPI001C4BA586|nr:probable beta-1,4-xylosyltransferase IRX9H [Zingiber officinale]
MASIRRTSPLKGHFMVGKEQHYAPSLLLDFRCRRSFVRALFLSFLAGFFWGLVSFPDLEGPTLSPPHGLFHDPDASSLNSISVEVEDAEEVGSPFNKLLIIVTPTYNRAAQGYHLTRLAQTLRLVPPPLLWIVVEMKTATEETADVLRRSGVMYRHLVCRRNTSITLHRDLRQRHTALKHIKRHRLDGIVYFADDDNVYTLDLFHRLRQIRRFGTWPVAMLLQSKSKIAVEGPVCDGRRVVGWHINEKNTTLQRFPVDMSGFAFNSNILWHPKDVIRLLDTVTDDFEDTGFLEQIIEDEYQMEAVPRDCPRIMHWRLQLEAKHLAYPKGWKISKNLNGIIPLNQEF